MNAAVVDTDVVITEAVTVVMRNSSSLSHLHDEKDEDSEDMYRCCDG